MQSAFLMFGVFPPPPTGPGILSGLDGPCTWLAANARVSFVMQDIIGNIPFVDVVPYLFFSPVDQGVQFDQAVLLITFYHLIEKPGDSLVLPEPAYPYIHT